MARLARLAPGGTRLSPNRPSPLMSRPRRTAAVGSDVDREYSSYPPSLSVIRTRHATRRFIVSPILPQCRSKPRCRMRVQGSEGSEGDTHFLEQLSRLAPL